MSNKPSVLLTLLEHDDGLARTLGGEIARLGANVQAHFWNDRPDAQVLAQIMREICSPDLGAWVIAGARPSFTPQTMAALSLCAIAARHARVQQDKADLPVIFSPSGVEQLSLPTPLSHAKVVVRGLGARVIAAVHTKRTADPAPYRLNVLALHGLGLWIEAGPARDPWQGALLGARGCSPDHHCVGQAGVIPPRCTLRYPVCGMQLQAASGEFTAFGCDNTLTPAESYFVRLDGLPEALIFGPFPKDDSSDLYVLDLC